MKRRGGSGRPILTEEAMQVQEINVRQRIALTDTGEPCSISVLLDDDGDETDDHDCAVVAVVLLPNGKWEAVDLRLFDAVRIS